MAQIDNFFEYLKDAPFALALVAVVWIQMKRDRERDSERAAQDAHIHDQYQRQIAYLAGVFSDRARECHEVQIAAHKAVNGLTSAISKIRDGE